MPHDRLLAVGGLADDGEVRFDLDQAPEPRAHERVVVADEDA